MSTITYDQLTIRHSSLQSVVLAVAILSSSVVFSEPAPVDILMACFLALLCLTGGMQLGALALANLAMWLVIVAFGLIAAQFSPEFVGAVKHQIVTLFLVLMAAAIASFVANDPGPRGRLVLNCYTISLAVACVFAYIGYFKLLPGAYDLFTNYGRARGSFKDPNVFGAALGPAITYLCWRLIRTPDRRALLPAAGCLFMTPALLINFSRGAWISAFISLALMSLIAFARTRRKSDRIRLTAYAVIGILAIAVTFTALLQIPKVGDLMRERASLTQSYDEGPEGRFGGQSKAIQLVLDNPLGIGTHTFSRVHHHEQVHNVYLTMFQYSGWIGGFLFIASMLTTFTVGLIKAMHPSDLQGALAVSVAALAGLIVESLIIDSDHWRHFYIVLGLIWGLSDTVPTQIPSARRWYDTQRVSAEAAS